MLDDYIDIMTPKTGAACIILFACATRTRYDFGRNHFQGIQKPQSTHYAILVGAEAYLLLRSLVWINQPRI